MKMCERVISTFILSVVLFAFTGCVSMEKEPDEKAIKRREKLQKERSAVKVEKIAIEFKNNFFNGMVKKDYKLFSKAFIPELKEKLSAKSFPKLCETFEEANGKIIKCEYMGELDRYIDRIFVWKIRFKKDLIKLKDGTTVPRDRMFYIIIGKVDGKYRMFGARII